MNVEIGSARFEGADPTKTVVTLHIPVALSPRHFIARWDGDTLCVEFVRAPEYDDQPISQINAWVVGPFVRNVARENDR